MLDEGSDRPPTSSHLWPDEQRPRFPLPLAELPAPERSQGDRGHDVGWMHVAAEARGLRLCIPDDGRVWGAMSIEAVVSASAQDGLRVEATDPRRSALTARIGGKDTTPELAVRRLLHRLGYRFRLHAKDLPGRPDIVFRGRRKAVFIHGCFWHRHEGCPRATTPKTRRDFWDAKFAANVERDARKEAQLVAAGWSVLVVWECETRDLETLQPRLIEFLGQPGPASGGAAPG